MPRTQRTWSQLRAEIRRLLREEDASASYWEDQDLLDLFNQAIDLRVMEAKTYDENFFIERYDTDLVKDQEEYTLPAGTSRVRNVWRRLGDNTFVPLRRDERREKTVSQPSSVSGNGYTPTFRLRGPNIVLEPKPTFSDTDGLVIEVEIMPVRVSSDSDTIDSQFPLELETLLVYDTAVFAVAEEDSAGNEQRKGRESHIMSLRQRYEDLWQDLINRRVKSQVYTRPYLLGD